MMNGRILILDGAMGTMVQSYGLGEADFRGKEFAKHATDLKGDNDVLNITRSDVIEEITRRYIEAGADIVSTNTFNSNRLSQEEYGLGDAAREMARAGASIARKAADAAGHKVLVAGSIGPTGKTASMSPRVDDPGFRDVTFDDLAEAYAEQIEGLTEGGADMLLFETVFDTLNLKAGLEAAARVAGRTGRTLPVMVSLTIAGKDGRTLSGQTIEAFVASISHAPLFSVGINCSFGPREIKPWLRKLAEISPWPVSCHPNAGLPDAEGNYNETPGSMASAMAELVDEGLVNIIGGCCGTTPAHIAEYSRITEGKPGRHVPERVEGVMTLAGLEPLEVSAQKGFVNVGERCNVAGSRKFLRLISEGNYGEALGIARRQIADGAQVIDINMDDGLLDAGKEMVRFLNLLAAEPEIARVPVMIDSSKWDVIESGLKRVQGKAIVNSISLKEGEETFLGRARKLNRLGAAVVVMAFDEQGQADTYERKIEVMGRAYRLLTGKAAFPAGDIIFDPNVLTIATGIAEHDRYGLDFIRATAWVKENLPGARVSGGLSNLSFAFRGNNPLREAMHSVFLHHAVNAGMDMAILNPATRVDYESIDRELRDLLEDVILCRRDGASEDLAAYAAAHPAVKKAPGGEKASVKTDTPSSTESLSVEHRLEQSLVEGDESHLDSDLREALAKGMEPVEIIDGPLMAGMDRVGQLFGEGRMFLPQVVKTARTMKKAVSILQPEIDRRGSRQSSAGKAGRILIATVKGDVHDIGKNIVAIILACNNYDVTDLGVMVPARTIVEKAKEVSPDIICLSGLITPSLDEMVNVARELREAGIDTPLMVGGATTSRLHTALKIDPEYDGAVIHVPDAAQNPLIAARLLDSAGREEYIASLKAESERLRNEYAAKKENDTAAAVGDEAARKCRKASHPAPAPREKSISIILDPDELAALINWKAYLVAWKLPSRLDGVFTTDAEGDAEAGDDYLQAVRLAQDTRDVMQRFIGLCTKGECSVRGLVRILPARSTGNDSIVLTETDGTTYVFPTPRRRKPDSEGMYPSLCDFITADGRDYAGAFAVSVDSEKLKKEYASQGDSYRELIVESLAHRFAEAASQWLHGMVAREMWGYAGNNDVPAGIRPAIGYPSLPDQLLNHELNRVLGMEAIGITMTENGAMHPSASVSGLYIAAPEAKYFTV